MFPKISILICVSEKDLSYLFESAVDSCFKRINFANNVYIVTPEPSKINHNIYRQASKHNKTVTVLKDSDILSKSEQRLCGWGKQQIIKLRSYLFCNNEYVLNVGADTVILKDLNLSDFYDNSRIVIQYRKHKLLDKHYLYEIDRVKSVYRIFKIDSKINNATTRDYIFDVFLFRCDVLRKLEEYFIKRNGRYGYVKLFPKIVNNFVDMGKVGEWTLYCIFVIEILKLDYVFRDGTKKVRQIHSKRELEKYDYSDTAVHFVRSDFDKDFIIKNIRK